MSSGTLRMLGGRATPCGTEDRATRSFGLGAQDKAFSSVLQLHFGQAVQIELDVCPLAGDLFGLKALLQGSAQDESQKGAEHVSSDRPVVLVVHRASAEQGLG